MSGVTVMLDTVAGSGLDFSKFDAYIDNIGVIFYEGQGATQGDSSRPIRAEALDTGQNRNRLHVESGKFFDQNDFTHGGGQSFFHPEGSDTKKYSFGDGFDIAEAGKLTHLWRTQEALDNTDVGRMIQIAGVPLVAAGAVVKRGNGSFAGTWTSETLDGTDTVNDIAAGGSVGYAAMDDTAAPLYTRAAGGTTWAIYQYSGTNITLDTASRTATKLAYLRGRLLVVGSKSGAGDALYEVDGSTATPPNVGPTMPAGWAIEDIFTNGPYVYLCYVNADQGKSEIHHLEYDTTTSRYKPKGFSTLVENELIYCGTGYLSKVFLAGGRRNNSGGYDPIVYQAGTSDAGELGLETLLAEEEGAGSSDLSVRVIKPAGRSILFGWSLTSSATTGAAREGIARYDLARGAFSHDLRKVTAAGTPARVKDILVYKGRTLFTVTSDGLFYEDISTYADDSYVVSSVADWNSASLKNWDLITVSYKPLPTSTQIDVYYSTKLPEEDDWTLVGSCTVADSTSKEFRLTDVTSEILAIKLVSNTNGSGTAAPTIIGFSVRSNPSPEEPEWATIRHIRILPNDRKDQWAPEINQQTRTVRNSLLDKLHTWVTLYEPDNTWTCFVENCSTLEPAQAIYRSTEGEQGRECFVLSLELHGTRA